MEKPRLPTRFLSAERSSPEMLAAERRAFDSIPILRNILDSVPQWVLVLDPNRQIVFVNRSASEAIGKPEQELVGLRPGEALGCVHAKEVSGCGTTEHCTVCGAGLSLLSVARGRDDERDCRMIVSPPAKDLDLSVRATRLRQGDLTFTIFVATDRSGENRRRALEKLFFHDVLNTAGAVSGVAELLPGAAGDQFNLFCQILQQSSNLLLDQITAQRDLTSVENGEYVLHVSPCPTRDFIAAVVSISGAHSTAYGRRIDVDEEAADALIRTDRGLLMRVVGNMIKNALEAEPPGAAILIGCDARPEGGAEIWVRNPSVMPRASQLQLFQRAFSTKGEGRGLGTYSMRLLTESYLDGKVTFRSEEGFGTEFRVSLPAAVKG